MSARPGNLRSVAEEIERATGLRVEILGGKLVMSPTPRGKHAGVIRRLRKQIEPVLADGLGAYEVSSIAMPDDPDDYCTPDLVILPEEWDEDDDWLADPRDVELAVEVISKSERTKDIAGKGEWYAAAGVRLLLSVDPRRGVWTLHSRPKAGEYQGVLHGEFGDDVPLPEPLGIVLDTGCLPVYDVP
ncbi:MULTISPECIES: Uma2 family endonuclease [unclassified Streptomyces]|uniref:Uma2 family endonuclease n=1 Tax=unclassified Streptomyces TaxID=2593676 RepID=UPI0022B7497E|nr:MULTISPECIES: Uma2 family endonuclease [unclassified Streptomyces]MCZ7413191.1 Uma2 family endonuclease [Streptomyces sp. WMMC897]MCZ7417775.1 Uma2 family endonuclease [Streptomyces sp. WMMC897]MCZ7432429.1 Uma2 family endonuclease [Streptomyces sp. WMMC1477]